MYKSLRLARAQGLEGVAVQSRAEQVQVPGRCIRRHTYNAFAL